MAEVNAVHSPGSSPNGTIGETINLSPVGDMIERPPSMYRMLFSCVSDNSNRSSGRQRNRNTRDRDNNTTADKCSDGNSNTCGSTRSRSKSSNSSGNCNETGEIISDEATTTFTNVDVDLASGAWSSTPYIPTTTKGESQDFETAVHHSADHHHRPNNNSNEDDVNGVRPNSTKLSKTDIDKGIIIMASELEKLSMGACPSENPQSLDAPQVPEENQQQLQPKQKQQQQEKLDVQVEKRQKRVSIAVSPIVHQLEDESETATVSRETPSPDPLGLGSVHSDENSFSSYGKPISIRFRLHFPS